jgi:hypothetical protein
MVPSTKARGKVPGSDISRKFATLRGEEDTDRPALLGEAPVPGADVAPRVGVHVRAAGVPEEPDVLLI